MYPSIKRANISARTTSIKRALSWASLPALALALVACGGGGSGGGSSFSPVSEVERNYAVSAVNATRAYELGYTGQGISVAVIDTGISHAGGELTSAISPLSYSVITNSDDVTDTSGHGTSVAGVIAAARNQSGVMGVAYNANILSIKSDYANGRFSSGHLSTAINYAVNQGAPIINMSIAGSNPPPVSMYLAMDNAVSAGTLLVIAAGNNSQFNPEYPARYAGDFSGDGQVLAVGSVDSNQDISAFSSRAGDQKEFYLVAPGEGVSVIKPDGSVEVENGTSFAAPVVSAAASIIAEQASHLTGREIADILLQTATDLGVAGVDDIYGHGLLDVAKALQPYGVVIIPSSTTVASTAGNFSPASSTTIYFDPAFSKAMMKHELLTEVMALDDYGRPYKIDLTQIAERSDPSIDMLDWLRGDSTATGWQNSALLDASGKQRLSWGQAKLNRSTVEDITRGRFAQFASSGDRGGWAASFGLSLNSALGMSQLSEQGLERGAQDKGRLAFQGLSTSVGARQAGENPFLSYTGQTGSFAAEANVNDRLTFRAAVGVNRALSEQRQKINALASDGRDPARDQIGTLIANSASSGFAAEAGYRASEKFTFSFNAGWLEERGRFLNSYSAGAFGQNVAAQTNFAGVNALYEATPKLQFFGGMTVGQSTIDGDALGLYRDYSTVASSAFTLGMSRTDVIASKFLNGRKFDFQDRVTLTLSQPLRIEGGAATLSVPIARTDAGEVIRQDQRLGLSPDGRQLDLFAAYELGWSKGDGRGGITPTNSLSFLGGVTRQPGHDASADTAVSVGAKFRREY